MRNSENIVTVKKIIDNLKSKWWVLVISMLMAIFVIFYSNKKENDFQGSVYTVKTLLCLQKDLSESEVISSDRIIIEENEIRNDNLMNQNASYVANMLNTLINSKEIQEEVLLRMNQGSETQFPIVEPKFIASSRVVEFSIDMENVEKAVELINIYSEVLCEKVNEILSGEKLVVLEKADLADFEIEIAENQQVSILTIKNVFIVLVCLCGGLFCILLIVLADTKIRDPFEVENIVPITYWGRIRKGKHRQKDIEKICAIARKSMADEDELKFVLLNKWYDTEVVFSEIFSKEERNFVCLLHDEKSAKQMSSTKRVVLAICSGRDKISELEENLVWLSAMGIAIEGYLLVD